MKKLVSGFQKATSVATSISLMAAFSAAAAFWFATGPSGTAQGTCQVCHKRQFTLTFPCTSLEYVRHLDHGDAMGPCGVTPVTNP